MNATKKDFQAIAEALSYARCQVDTVAGIPKNHRGRLPGAAKLSMLRAAHKTAISHAADNIAEVLAKSNPQFDRDRFLTACGVQA